MEGKLLETPLAPAFRRSMVLELSPASEGVARVSEFTLSSARVEMPMLSKPATPFRRGRMSSHRSSPFASSRLSFADTLGSAHAHDHAQGGSFGGAPDGGNTGGGAPKVMA